MANGTMKSPYVTVRHCKFLSLSLTLLIHTERCPNAPQIPNGNVVQSGREFKDTANYTCNFGYRLAKNHIPNLVCQQNGRWSLGQPRCVQS